MNEIHTRGKVKLLLVDDQQLIRMALKARLSKYADFTIVGEANSGKSAIIFARMLNPDVILMDIEMPELDGIEATRRIRARMPQMRVLILTSHAQPSNISAAFDAGADGYCLKIADNNDLANAIRTVSRGGCWLDSAIARQLPGAS